jgi:hypothetical protein
MEGIPWRDKRVGWGYGGVHAREINKARRAKIKTGLWNTKSN